jgi:hypothetical protein
MKVRQHGRAFDLHRLDDEDHHQRQHHQRKDKVTHQQARFLPQVLSRRVPGPLDLDIAIIIRVDGTEWGWLVELLTKHAIHKTNKDVTNRY